MKLLSSSSHRRYVAILAGIAAIGCVAIGLRVAPAAHASTTRYEAENAALSGGAIVATDHTGYSGGGFVGGYTDANQGTAKTAFTVSASTAGTYTVALGYADGNSDARTLTLTVDGGSAKQVTLGSTGSWDTWSTAAASVTLSAGQHSLAYSFGSADSGNVNLDYLDLTTPSSGGSGGPQYEAESAALSGGAVVASDHAGYTGSGFVGGYTDSDKGTARTTFTVTSAIAGTAPVALRYANGNGASKTLSVYVNGVKAVQTSLAATANWDSWASQSQSLTLKAGSNTIAYAFDSTDTGNVNLDNITVGTTTSSPTPTPTPTGTAPPVNGQYEAESAALSGGAVVAGDHAGYTGSGFVGGYTDGNKGTAATTFTVSSAIAGTAPVTLRYANGGGVTQTLSLYVNGSKALQTSLAGTANWDTWATRSESLTLAKGANTIAYRFDSTDTGNVNLDNIVVGSTVAPTPTPTPTTPPPTTPPPGGGAVYQAEAAFFSGGPTIASSFAGASGGSYLTGFGSVGARAIFTVNSTGNGPLAVNLRYSSSAAGSLHVYVNGAVQHQVSLASTGSGSSWATAGDTLTLRTGLNTITYRNDAADTGNANLDYLQLPTGAAMAGRGATVPYEEQEAENGVTNGTVIGPDRTFPSQATEASGRKAVKLSANGQYVQFTLAHPANSIVVRYSIPDSASGSEYDPTLGMYVNGTRSRSITLNNRYSWEYGSYPYDNSPSDGGGHHFYDEVRTLTSAMPAGTVVKLQKDATDTAGYYIVDLVDFEQVDAAYPMPAGFLNITSYGATANDGTDDTNAINSAVSAAESQGKGLWVPAGQFEISAHINLANVTIRGAGPWYSILHGANGLGGLFATGSQVQIFDLGISGDVTYRNDSAFQTGIEGNFGTGSMIQNVWVEHTKVGMWPDTGTNGLYIGASRIRDTMADGINIHGGAANTTYLESTVRNTGDDAMAMDSEGGTDSSDALLFDTAQVPVLANTAGVYGGTNMRIEDNLLSDTVIEGSGIAVSTRFGNPFTGPVSVQRNTLTRTGSLDTVLNGNNNLGALWIYAAQSDITTPVIVNNNLIQDSTNSGILINLPSSSRTISNLSFTDDQITTTGSYGIEIRSAGAGTFTGVTVSGAAAGGLAVSGGFTITRGAGDTGW